MQNEIVRKLNCQLEHGFEREADVLYVWLANCYFAHNSLEFPVLLRFCDARSGRPVHPFHR
jgi:hypothetical protein